MLKVQISHRFDDSVKLVTKRYFSGDYIYPKHGGNLEENESIDEHEPGEPPPDYMQKQQDNHNNVSAQGYVKQPRYKCYSCDRSQIPELLELTSPVAPHADNTKIKPIRPKLKSNRLYFFTLYFSSIYLIKFAIFKT